MSDYNHGRAPTYVTKEDHVMYEGATGSKILPAHSFIRPIEWYYVPKHVIEDSRFKYTDEKTDLFCYTRYGIIPIKRSNIITI